MITFSQEVINEIVNILSHIVKNAAYLIGHLLNRLHDLNEACSELIQSFMDGYHSVECPERNLCQS
jgi:hypothetical protein